MNLFVTIGTSEPFDRLLRAVDALEWRDEIVAQIGRSSVVPRRARCAPFLSYAETVESMRCADVVVAHAGAGTVLTALAVGRVPVVVPRLKREREAVDDHQLAFSRRLDTAGLVVAVEDLSQLGAAIVEAGARSGRPSQPSLLASDLRTYIAAKLSGAGR